DAWEHRVKAGDQLSFTLEERLSFSADRFQGFHELPGHTVPPFKVKSLVAGILPGIGRRLKGSCLGDRGPTDKRLEDIDRGRRELHTLGIGWSCIFRLLRPDHEGRA